MHPQSLASLAYYSFLDSSGELIHNGLLYLFEENSNNPATAFYDAKGEVPIRQWPVPLDTQSVANIWLIQGKPFRIVVKNEFDTIVLYENGTFRCGEATSEAGLTSEMKIKFRGKTITYTNGLIDEVLFYKDDDKTEFVKRFKFNYDETGVLDHIKVYNAKGKHLRTRQLEREGGLLTSYRIIEQL